jgi:2,3-bisphosphoglycerate-dependent phosphoglycerate mutase
MKLLIVRHGETQFNAEGRYLGALDADLNVVGISQAEALHFILPDALDGVVCSPLRRARRTAEILCQGRSVELSIDEAFRERNVGVFEGLTREEAQSRFPALWAQNVTRQWKQAPTGGETIAEVVERVVEGLGRMYEKYQDRVIVLVAHGFVAKVARAVTQAGFDDFFEWQLANGTVCELVLTTDPAIERAMQMMYAIKR